MHEEDKEEKEDECAMCQEYLNGWKRALADYDNLKKELAGERIRMRQSAIEGSAASFIPILDHFDQALAFKPTDLDEHAKKWLQGILHIRGHLEGAFQEIGLESFGKEGEMLDPHMHETVSEEEQEGAVSGTIIRIVQRGWKLNDHILRPAKVVIAK